MRFVIRLPSRHFRIERRSKDELSSTFSDCSQLRFRFVKTTVYSSNCKNEHWLTSFFHTFLLQYKTVSGVVFRSCLSLCVFRMEAAWLY